MCNIFYLCSVKQNTKQNKLNQLNFSIMKATKKITKKFVSMLETMSEYGLKIAYYSQKYDQKFEFTVSYNKEYKYFVFKTPNLQASTFADGITDFKSQNDFFDYVISMLHIVKY